MSRSVTPTQPQKSQMGLEIMQTIPRLPIYSHGQPNRIYPQFYPSRKHLRRAVTLSAEELGTVSKNNLRGFTKAYVGDKLSHPSSPLVIRYRL